MRRHPILMLMSFKLFHSYDGKQNGESHGKRQVYSNGYVYVALHI